MSNRKKTVVCGMSGGVDSSVSALLLKLKGYQTLGLFMRNWEETDEEGVCAAEKDFKDVVAVCEILEIPYYSVDFTQEYWDKVFTSFLREYEAGNTPNPDILCNKEIKFNVFYQRAMDMGADFLATGHYCRKSEGKDGRSVLLKGLDGGKDQSYFLCAIKGEALQNTLFPVGELPKKTVRLIASDFGLSVSAKKDSTGICFIGERNFKNFLSQYLKTQSGNFVRLEDGKVMGPHSGYCFYTIGQRKGLGIGGPGGPWFVAGKDPSGNTVYVVEGEKHPALYARELWFEEASWIGSEPAFPLLCKAKARYRQADQECRVTKDGGRFKVEFERPQRALALKQSVVLYLGDICLGGGPIVEVGKSLYEEKQLTEAKQLTEEKELTEEKQLTKKPNPANI